MDYKEKIEVLEKLDEIDMLIREGISSFDTVISEREHLTKARTLLQECLTEILLAK